MRGLNSNVDKETEPNTGLSAKTRIDKKSYVSYVVELDRRSRWKNVEIVENEYRRSIGGD